MHYFKGLGITLSIIGGLFLFAVLLVPIEVIEKYFSSTVQVSLAILTAAVYALSLLWLSRRNKIA
jgi:hypothetical protein